MRYQELEVARRRGTGKGAARKLRAQGHVPGVCYRKGLDPILLSLEQGSFERILRSASGPNILIQLKIEDAAGPRSQETVIVKEVQKDHFHRMLHVDFLGVLMDQLITVEVVLRLVGDPSEAMREGGIVQQLRRVVELECLPGNIPECIDVDISSLKIGASIHVEQLKVPEGSRILTDPKEAVVVVSAPVEEVEEKEAKPEEVEPGEGEAEAEEGKDQENGGRS